MIFKNLQILIIFFLTNFFIFCFQSFATTISIVAYVQDEIITNYDVKKELEYLKILNPSLDSIKKSQLLDLAKSSIINEIIKKKEISKFVMDDKKNIFVDDQLKDLYLKLNFKNIEEFENYLKIKGNISLAEMKEKISIELFWNEMIYVKYKDQIRIDKEKIVKEIDDLKNNFQNEYFLSEITFTKKKNKSIENLIDEIKLSIKEIGFENTANIYSISASAKLGGKLGWIDKNRLSNLILNELNLIGVGDHTNAIKVGKNYLILKIAEIRKSEIKIDKNQKINDLIRIKTNQQLAKFSKIYFDKLKMNYTINEL